MHPVQPPSIQRVMKARHSSRPYLLDYIQHLLEDFVELYGDRRFADDPALLCGFANFHDFQVGVMGHQKGRDTRERRLRNFGMPKPEGYRKALRFMKLAEKFNRPVLTFIDTPGAYPGIDAEEHGQAEAIARNLLEMARLNIPVITSIIGEGGSGGALAIGVSDRVLMLENAIYSVISPEGCAAILWKDAAKSPLAAEALKLTASDLYETGIIDRIVKEPSGGAHSDLRETSDALDAALFEELNMVKTWTPAQRQRRRYQKLRTLGYA